MNKIAGNITFEQNLNFSIQDIYFVETQNLDGTFNYFFYGLTYDETSELFLKKLEDKAGIKSIDFDCSISSEDKIELYQSEQVNGIYTLTSFEGSEETFDSVLEKFSESSPYIVSIRESQVSKKFGSRVIKIDIVN